MHKLLTVDEEKGITRRTRTARVRRAAHQLKLQVVEKYRKQFATALTPYFPKLWYIDAFAGTGSRTVRHDARIGDLLDKAVPERIEQRRGSARIAIDVTPQFDTLVFIEAKPSHCAALQELARQHHDRDIRIVEDDANKAIQTEIARGRWDRAVIFLDPYGMDVEWKTLEAVAATKAIDVWYLFSMSGFYRQATRRMSDMDDIKREAITRQLGTDAWERELYSDLGQADFFGAEEKRRMADVKGLQKYAKARLETIFPKVLNPLALPMRGAQRYSLFFCMSNPDPKAVSLATRIAGHILKGNSS